MKGSIETLYARALMADAAYVSLETDGFVDDEGTVTQDAWDQDQSNPDKIETFQDIGFTREQFDTFRANYTVVHHQPDNGIGLSATLFRNNSDDQLTLAFRGTNGGADYVVDAALSIPAANNLADALNDGAITAFLQEAGLVDATGAPLTQHLGSIDVTGHSLGGYLSTRAAYEFPALFNDVTTFNSAAQFYGSPSMVFINTLWNEGVLDLVDAQVFPSERITNYYADTGLEVIASDIIGYRPGDYVPLFTEVSDLPQDGIDQHSMRGIVASLSVYRLFGLVDPDVTVEDATHYIDAMHNSIDGTLDKTLGALGTALGGVYEGLLTPDAFAAQLQTDLTAGRFVDAHIAAVPGSADHVLIAEDSAAGNGYRVALDNLHPFVISSVNATDASLDAQWFDSAYVEARTYLLDSLVTRNVDDADTVFEFFRGPEVFEDLATGIELQTSVAALFPDSPAETYGMGDAADNTLAGDELEDELFGLAGNDSLSGQGGDDLLRGGDGNDTLNGGDGSDFLAGEEGDDQLIGGPGNDLLIGGDGSDTYVFNAGDGFDEIHDSGVGVADEDRIVIDGRRLDSLNFVQVANGSNTWRDDDGAGVELRLSGSELVVSATGNTVVVGDFSESQNYGLRLDGYTQAPDPLVNDAQTDLTIQGDREPLDSDPDTEGVQADVDALGNVIIDPLVESVQDDRLYGDASADAIFGGDGNDIIQSRAGNDWVEAGPGDDIVDGGAGDDVLLASGADSFEKARDPSTPLSAEQNWLQGGDGNDSLAGGAGMDGLAGGAGDDLILGGNGDDSILGDATLIATDVAWTVVDDLETGFRTIEPLAGNYYPAEGGADEMHGGQGNDWMLAGPGDDRVFGDDGSDQIGGEAGDDLLEGGDGNDLIVGDADEHIVPGELHGDDSLAGGAGDDELNGQGGADRLYGGDGNDLLFGDGAVSAEFHGDDRLLGEAGNDWLQGGGGNDFIDGGEGDDIASADGGDDVVHGGDGDDSLYGDSSSLAPDNDGNDAIYGDAGNDQLIGGGGDDRMFGGDDDDTAWGMDGNDFFYGGDGVDRAYGGLGNDHLVGGDGDDVLLGEGDDDRVEGGAGKDILQGDSGNDVVFAGAGNDIAIGGTGDDEVHGGAGQDEVGGGEGNDHVLGDGGNDLVYGDDGNDQVEGGAGADTLYGDAGTDTLRGGPGDDELFGGAGDDRYVFGVNDGDDRLTDTEGVSTLEFEGLADGQTLNVNYLRDTGQVRVEGVGTSVTMDADTWQSAVIVQTTAGPASASEMTHSSGADDDVLLPSSDDVLHLRAGDDVASGGGGNDRLYGDGGDDTLRGDAGDDLLAGGEGNDLLDGGSGNDTYVFGVGDGIDTIAWRQPDEGEADTITLGAGISPDEVVFRDDGNNNLRLELSGRDDALVINNWFNAEQVNAVAEIRFEDDPQTVWGRDQIAARTLVPNGTDADDLVGGTGGADGLDGLTGNDVIYGYGGDDVLAGGDGDDRLIGGPGDDQLAGGAGSDVYVFGYGDGQDVIADQDASPGRVDAIEFGAGITPSDVRVRQVDKDLLLELSGADDAIKVSNHFVEKGKNKNHHIDEVRFGDGTVWARDDIAAIASQLPAVAEDLIGTPADETIQGARLGEALFGEDGDDTLLGGKGDDLLIGGPGNDLLDGGWGDDTYLLEPGDGADVIDNRSSKSGDQDSLSFDGGIDSDELWFQRSSDDLLISVIGTDDSVAVTDWYLDASAQIDEILTDDRVLLAGQVEQLVQAMAAFDAPLGEGAVLSDDQRAVLDPVLAASWQPAA